MFHQQQQQQQQQQLSPYVPFCARVWCDVHGEF
jgi:hypothetical protein